MQRRDGPGCIRCAMRQRVPVALSDMEIGAIRAGNTPSLDRLASIGLPSKSGSADGLTSPGQRAYQAHQQCFCNSADFSVQKTFDIVLTSGSQDGSMAKKAWAVTRAIAQRPIVDWTRDPNVAAITIDKSALATEPRTDHVVLARYRGGAGVRLNDPMFVLPKRFNLAEGF